MWWKSIKGYLYKKKSVAERVSEGPCSVQYRSNVWHNPLWVSLTSNVESSQLGNSLTDCTVTHWVWMQIDRCGEINVGHKKHWLTWLLAGSDAFPLRLHSCEFCALLPEQRKAPTWKWQFPFVDFLAFYIVHFPCSDESVLLVILTFSFFSLLLFGCMW